MNGKKILSIILGILLCIIIVIVLVGYILINKGYGISVGKYLESNTGTPMFVSYNSPISMSNRTNRDLFKDLDIGDEILILHSGIMESYPGQSGVYFVFKLSDGTTSDIPEIVISQLQDLGWLE